MSHPLNAMYLFYRRELNGEWEDSSYENLMAHIIERGRLNNHDRITSRLLGGHRITVGNHYFKVEKR